MISFIILIDLKKKNAIPVFETSSMEMMLGIEQALAFSQ